MAYSKYITTIFPLLLIIAFFNLYQTHAWNRNPNPNSIVLGLTHSATTSFPTPKLSKYSRKRLLEVSSDMIEPLRGVRDGYLITLNIGTPGQVIQVYMDTGSDLTWVPCGNLSFNCLDCDDYKNIYRKLVSTNFSPSRSSSYVRDSCGSSFCIDIHSSDNSFDPCVEAGCSLNSLLKSTCVRPCPSFAYTYGEGGLIIGTLTKDNLRVHGTSSEITRDSSRFIFGCVGSTYREPIGIAGFGRGVLSFPSQFGFLQKGFSHCFLAFKYANNPNISSPLSMGDIAISSNENLQFTPMLKSPMFPNYYYIGLESITITIANTNTTTTTSTSAEVPLNLKEFDSKGNGGMLIDSGTTYTHLPEPSYSQLLSILQSAITYPRATDVETPTGFDLCYKVPCPNNKFTNDPFPSITFHFLNNVSLILPQANYFYPMSAPSNSTGVKCLLFQRMGDGDFGPAGVFGNFQQQNVKVVYDLKHERIGFQPMDCAAAATAASLSGTNSQELIN